MTLFTPIRVTLLVMILSTLGCLSEGKVSKCLMYRSDTGDKKATMDCKENTTGDQSCLHVEFDKPQTVAGKSLPKGIYPWGCSKSKDRICGLPNSDLIRNRTVPEKASRVCFCFEDKCKDASSSVKPGVVMLLCGVLLGLLNG